MTILDTTAGGELIHQLDLLEDGNHRFQVIARDIAGNESVSEPMDLVIDTLPPPIERFELSAGSIQGAASGEQTRAGVVTFVGQTEPLAQVEILGTESRSMASAVGSFQIPSVGLQLGENTIVIRVMDRAGNVSEVTRTATRLELSDDQDAVLYWNEVILDTIRRDASTPPYAKRALAMMNLAIADVLSTVEGTPGFYVAQSPQVAQTYQAEAAVAAAAHEVLTQLYPAQRPRIDGVLATTLSTISDEIDSEHTTAIELGREIGQVVIDARRDDG